MAKRELTAKTSLAGLRRGNPGNRGGPGRPLDAYRQRSRYWEERSQGLEVLARIVSGDIYEMLGTKNGEVIVGQTANADRIRAYATLRDSAGYGPPRADVPPVEGGLVFVIVTPPRAKTAEQWLKLHERGGA